MDSTTQHDATEREWGVSRATAVGPAGTVRPVEVPRPAGPDRHPAGAGARPARAQRLLAMLLLVSVVAFGGGLLGGWVGDSLREQPTSSSAVQTMVTRGANAFSGGLDVAAAFAAVEPGVVSVGTTFRVRQGPSSSVVEGAGTGIVLTADGEILTNAHVVASATTITVTYAGSTRPLTARLIDADTSADIALIKVEGGSGMATAPLGDSDTLQIGDDVIAIGNALALDGGHTVTRGIVSALNRSVATDTGTLVGMIQTDSAISSGNSGGPLVNAAGQVVGMNTAVATSSSTNTAENIGFAIPIDAALRVVDRLRNS